MVEGVEHEVHGVERVWAVMLRRGGKREEHGVTSLGMFLFRKRTPCSVEESQAASSYTSSSTGNITRSSSGRHIMLLSSALIASLCAASRASRDTSRICKRNCRQFYDYPLLTHAIS